MSDNAADNGDALQKVASANIAEIASFLQSLLLNPPQNAVEQREQSLMALGHVIGMLGASGINAYQLTPLRTLFIAINELDFGIAAPMLKPGKAGRAVNKQSAFQWMAKAYILVALEACYRDRKEERLTVRDSTKKIMSKLPEIEKLHRKINANMIDTILDWRRNFSKMAATDTRTATNRQALSIYQSGMQRLRKGSSPRQEMERALESARYQLSAVQFCDYPRS